MKNPKKPRPILAKNAGSGAARRNLRLVMAESAITDGLLCMPFMTPFFHSVGCNNEQVALIQIIFTVVVMVLNLPTGYLADRISRKWANIIGDFGHAALLFCYSKAGNIPSIILCEISLGLMSALSGSVDQTLLKHFASKLAREKGEPEDSLIKTKTAELQIAKQACNAFLMLVGGPIGAISPRLAIALSGVTQLMGGVISIFIDDDSEKLQPREKSAWRDMLAVAKEAFTTPQICWRMLAFAVAREITHGLIWIITPVFVAAGLPANLISLAWLYKSVMSVAGAKLALHSSHKLSEPTLFMMPAILMSFAMIIMGIHLDIVTVWLYGLAGITQGWTAAILMPMLQNHVEPAKQTSIISLAGTMHNLLYLPSVWLICRAADYRLEYGLFMVVVIFLPLSLLMWCGLKKNANAQS